MKKTRLLTLSAIIALLPAAAAADSETQGTQSPSFPQKATLHYVGPYGVPAVMTFERNGNRYRVVADINAPLYKMRFTSQGSINGTRLSPASYSDIRRGKPYAAAQFDYAARTVSYGKTGETRSEAMQGPAMDLFTLSWQLALNGGRLPAGLQITNGKRIYPVSGMTRLAPEHYNFNGGSITVNRFRVQRGGDTVEYAFAPDLSNIPARIKYSDDGKVYELKLRSAEIDGVPVQAH